VIELRTATIARDAPTRRRPPRGSWIAAWVLTAALGAGALAGCGGTQPAPSQSMTAPARTANTSQPTTATAGQTKTNGSTTAAVSRLGCGQYCMQAGVGQASVAPGYPCPAPSQQNQSGCLTCPPQHCMELLSTRASVSKEAFVVRLRCNLSTRCVGAFLVCVPTELCGAGSGVPAGYGGRVAGSDFAVAAGGEADVSISLTPLGRQLASSRGGYHGDVLVDLENYGDLTLPVPPAEAPLYSAKALACISPGHCSFAASLRLAS
jgi:hypothetical protein